MSGLGDVPQRIVARDETDNDRCWENIQGYLESDVFLLVGPADRVGEDDGFFWPRRRIEMWHRRTGEGGRWWVECLPFVVLRMLLGIEVTVDLYVARMAESNSKRRLDMHGARSTSIQLSLVRARE